MADDDRLISRSVHAAPAFRRDVRTLLKLSPVALRSLGQMSDSPDGLLGVEEGDFARAAEATLSDATRAVSVASYLYERARKSKISGHEAAEQLAEYARDIGLDESDIIERKAAIEELLSPKPTYEREGQARRQGTVVVDHFVSASGVWDLRPVFDRQTEKSVDYIPVLLVSMTWHDDVGNSQRSVFQMSEDEWIVFLDAMGRIDRERQTVLADLNRLRAAQ